MNGTYSSTAPGLGCDQDTPQPRIFDRRWLAAVKHLRCGRAISDLVWDRIYPTKYAELSPVHWTPVSVARRAADLLSRGTQTRVLDIGSGVGKFCVIAALTTPGLFVGVERRGEMVDVARQTAHRAATSRTRFIHANANDIDWTNFNGFYLYNPFEELWRPDVRSVGPPGTETTEYRSLVSFTQQCLVDSRPGTRVVTYHGFGGEMPSCFQLTLLQPCGRDFLECWERE